MLSTIKKMYYILDEKAKVKIKIMLVLMVTGSCLEALSISLILPFISVVSNTKEVLSPPWLHQIYQMTGVGSINKFIVLLGGVMLGAYLFKNIFIFFVYLYQNKFIYNQQAIVSRNLLHAYLYGPYTFHLQRNSAELLRNLTLTMGAVFGSGVIPFIQFLSEFFVVIAVVTMIILVEPQVALYSILILGVLTGLFYRVVRRKITYYGKGVQDSSTSMILWVNQSLGGIKEITVLGRQLYFLQKYSKHRFDNAKYNIYFSTLQKIPRLYTELTLIGGMLLIMMLVMIRGEVLSASIPIVSLFAMASVRLMPSVNQIVISLNSMRFGTAAIEDIYKDVRFFRENSKSKQENKDGVKVHFTREIRLANLNYTYARANVPALSAISLRIRYGESVALVGASGAGKTTLANIILGLLSPTSGKLLVDGVLVNCDAQTLSAWQENIGYIPQDIFLADDTLRRNIAFGVDDQDIDDERLNNVISQVHLKDVLNYLPEGIDTYVGERGIRLSGGQRQRVGIARALYHNPGLLVMDEATSSLDNETESKISQTIEGLSGQKTIIIIAHRLSTVKKCDKLFFIKDGRLNDIGTYEELIGRNTYFRAMAQQPECENIS